MKYFYSFILCLSIILSSHDIGKGQPATTCPNSDFDLGNFNDWIGCYGTFTMVGSNPVLSPCITPGFAHTWPTPGRRHIIEVGPGYHDPYSCDSIITVFPGDAYSARLGDTSGGGHAEQLKYQIFVNNANYLFIYRYAVVLESPNHSYNQQPGFSIAVENLGGVIIDSTCGYYLVYSPTCTNPPLCPQFGGWKYCQGVGYGGDGCYWKNWTTVGMNLSQYLGQTIQIVFTTHGCAYTAHRGYAYISAYCSYLTIQTSMCQGDSSATLTAPAGFAHYHWSTGDTIRQIVIPHPTLGDTLNCILTALNGCVDTIWETLTYTVITTNFYHGSACSGINTQFYDSSYVNQNFVTGWKWNFGDGTPIVTGVQNPLHVFALPGIYNVKLVSHSTEGCKDSITKLVTVDTLPILMNNPLFEKICSGINTNITLIPNKPAYNFTWTATANSPLVTGYSSNTTIPGYQINQVLTNTDNKIDTVTYHVTPHSPNCTGIVTNYKVAVKPVPILTNASLSKSICDSLSTNITLTSNNDSTFFTWTCTASSPDVSGYSDNTTNPVTLINQVLYNAGIGVDTVTYHIVPQSFGCIGTTTYNYKVIVYPMPALTNNPLNQSLCNNTSFNITLTSNVPGTLFTWTCTASSPNLAGYSNSAVPTTLVNQTLTNSGFTIETVTYHIVPHANACAGHTFNYVVTVFPVSDLNFAPAAPSICANQTTNILLSSDVANTSFTWTATCDSADVTGYGPGSGNTIAQTLGQPGYALETVTYHVYTSANSCTGDSANIIVLINPKPHLVTTPMNQTICSQTATNIVLQSSCLNTTFTWTAAVVTGNISGYSSGSGSPITQVLTNNFNTQGQVNYTILPTAGSCIGSDTLYSVFVNPKPHITTSPLTASLCSNTATNINLLSDVAGATFTWIATGSSGNVSGYSGGNGLAIVQTLINSGVVDETVTYHIDATASGCNSDTAYFIVTVHPLPVPVIMGSASVCLNSTTVYSTAAGMSNYIWTVSAGGTIISGAGTNTISVNWTVIGAQTVSVNYDNAFGCTAPSPTVFNVNVSLLPVPSLVGGNSICIGSSSTYTTDPGMSNYVWIVSAGGTITAGGGPANSTATILWTVTGAQTVSVNYQAGPGCSAPSPTTMNVTVNPLPVPTIAGTNNLCVLSSGIVYTTQPGMTAYTWSVSAGGTITAGGTAADNSATLTWNNTGAQTVSVSYTNGNGCTSASPTVYPVTVNALPVPAIAGPSNICSASTGNVYSTLAGMINYQWVVSAGGTITAGGGAANNTVTVTWNTPGAQTVSLNYHDANGCTALAPTVYNVTVNPLPIPTITGAASVCLNSTSTYTTEAGMTNYSWAVTAGGVITSGAGTNSITINWTSTGLKTISVNYFNGFNCTAQSPTTYNVTVNLLPVPLLTGTTGICSGFSATYTSDPGMNNYSWLVSAGGTITSGGGPNDNTVTVHWNAPGGQTVSVNYQMGTGCTAPAPTVLNVIVNPLPVVTLSGTPVLCAGSTNIVYGTQPGMSNYQWTVSAGGSITAGGTLLDNTVTVTWNTAGAQSVTVNYHDANGCTALSSTSYPVTVNPLPLPTISGPASVCLNSSSTYFTEAGMSNYTWSVSAGGSIIAGTGTNSITILWGTIGAKTITVNYHDANGCTAAVPTSFPVSVNTLPLPSLNGSNNTCTNTSVNYTTDLGMNNYAWSVSAGGSITAGGGTSDSFATVLWNTSGLQTVSVNYFMGTGCTAPSPTVLNVTVKPRPAITNAANSTQCSNVTTNIVFASTLVGTTFTWTATGSSGNVTGFSNGSGGSIVQTLVNTGFNIETVNYAVTPSLNGCDGPIANYIVTVNPVADVYFNPNGQTFCSSGTTSIAILSHVAGTTFTWTATGSSGNISGFAPGSGNLIAQTLVNSGTNVETVNYDVFPLANSCAGTDNHVIVNVNPKPQVSFTACNDIVTRTDAKSITLKGGLPLGGIYSGTGVNAGIFYPSLSGAGTFTITYSYTNTWGCNASMSQNITVINAIPFNCDNILTDIRDNQQYPTVKLGTQCWMASNLNYGTIIPSTSMQRDNCVMEKYCFNDNAGNCASYGGLYQWDEMMQYDNTPADQGFCPPAWHVPTNNEWNTLFGFYISNGFAGSPLKYTGYSGFNAFLSGTRFNNVNWNFSNFAVMFWTSTMDGTQKAWAHGMNTFNPSVSDYPSSRTHAFNIRCIKD